MRLRTTVYRAHNPRWSFAPLSGAGAARYGGRFNPTGMEALYTSRRFETTSLLTQSIGEECDKQLCAEEGS